MTTGAIDPAGKAFEAGFQEWHGMKLDPDRRQAIRDDERRVPASGQTGVARRIELPSKIGPAKIRVAVRGFAAHGNRRQRRDRLGDGVCIERCMDGIPSPGVGELKFQNVLDRQRIAGAPETDTRSGRSA